MNERVTDPSDLEHKEDDERLAAATATQLSVLLDSATALIDEEFRRSERLEAKSRNQITVVGSFFAVVQAVVIGLMNGSLGSTETEAASPFVPWLAGTGAVAAVAVTIALWKSYQAWRLQDDPALKPSTIESYIPYARSGNPAVGVNLTKAFAQIATDRRANNEKRVAALENAAAACGVAIGLAALELLLAFVGVALR